MLVQHCTKGSMFAHCWFPIICTFLALGSCVTFVILVIMCKPLIMYTIDVAKVVLENCIKKDEKEGTLTVTYEYEFLDDVEDKIPAATENNQKDREDNSG